MDNRMARNKVKSLRSQISLAKVILSNIPLASASTVLATQQLIEELTFSPKTSSRAIVDQTCHQKRKKWIIMFGLSSFLVPTSLISKGLLLDLDCTLRLYNLNVWLKRTMIKKRLQLVSLNVEQASIRHLPHDSAWMVLVRSLKGHRLRKKVEVLNSAKVLYRQIKGSLSVTTLSSHMRQVRYLTSHHLTEMRAEASLLRKARTVFLRNQGIPNRTCCWENHHPESSLQRKKIEKALSGLSSLRYSPEKRVNK